MLREALRAATADIHARLHRHPGFAAIQNRTIDLVGYRRLLVRLYGFHAAFEAAFGIAGDRSTWLKEDLTAIHGEGDTPESVPLCTALTAVAAPAGELGALYVVEGSMLGGRHLARHLDPLLGAAGTAGRRFFLGRGADTNAAWTAFLERLTSSALAPADVEETVDAAVSTFGIFQEWLGGWRDFS